MSCNTPYQTPRVQPGRALLLASVREAGQHPGTSGQVPEVTPSPTACGPLANGWAFAAVLHPVVRCGRRGADPGLSIRKPHLRAQPRANKDPPPVISPLNQLSSGTVSLSSTTLRIICLILRVAPPAARPLRRSCASACELSDLRHPSLAGCLAARPPAAAASPAV